MTESTTAEASVSIGLQEETQIRILHVDDETGFLKVAKQILETHENFKVDTASSVEGAEKKLSAITYDVVLSDYQMPGKDGLQFLMELRESGDNIPFIIFTGKGREEIAIEALNLGANQYINKIGNPKTVYGELTYAIAHAVKARKAEESLVRSEERYRSLVEEAGAGILIVDVQGAFTFVNNEFCGILGYSRRDLLGKLFSDFIHRDDRQRILQIFAGFMKNPELKPRFEFRAIHKNGNIIYLHSAPTIFQYKGQVIGSHAIITDITYHKQAEQALRETEEKYRNLVEMAPDGIITVNRKGVIDSVNSSFCKLTGFSEDELVGIHFTKLKTARMRGLPKFVKVFGDVLRGKAINSVEFQIKRREGVIRWGEANFGLLIQQNKVIGVQAVARDVTERKKAEGELVKSEEKYRNLVELAPDSIMTFDLKGIVTSVNTASTKLSGYTKNELVGKHFSKIGPIRARDIPKYLKMSYSTLKGKTPRPFEVVWLDKNRAEHLGEVRFSLLKENDKISGIQAILRETTKDRVTEVALKDAKEKWDSLTRNTDDIIMVVDSEGVIQHVNRTIPPYTLEETVGKKVYEYVPSDQLGTLRKSLRKVFKTGQPESYEVSLEIPKIGVIWFTTKAVPIKRDNKTIGCIMISADITKRKHVEEELKKTLQKLQILNEKLGVVGGLTRHDLRNKLSTVLGRIFLAKKKFGENPEAQENLSEAQSAVKEAERILNFAKEYESLGQEELAYVNVGDNVKSAVSFLPMAGAELEGVKIVEQSQNLRVLADSMLQQLFYNLIDNSLRHGKTVSQIKVYCETGKENLRLIYEDNGIGVSKAEKEKIFEKSYGKGTGYGLYLIKKLCEVYGWTIKETGKHGKGAQFTITMPKLDEQGRSNFKLD